MTGVLQHVAQRSAGVGSQAGYFPGGDPSNPLFRPFEARSSRPGEPAPRRHRLDSLPVGASTPAKARNLLDDEEDSHLGSDSSEEEEEEDLRSVNSAGDRLSQLPEDED